MPIRTKPFAEITADDARSLIVRQVREDRTIDFKQDLSLAKDGDRRELLKDVTAMANTGGGTLLYGAVEGESDESGQIVSLNGMQFSPDEVQSTITHLIRDGVEEPIPGLLHRALPLGDGTHLYVIRVPASHRAPHLFKFGKQRHNFYFRATTSNNPMTMSQIREAVLRSATARERAVALIDQRTELARGTARARERWSSTPQHDRLCRPGQMLLHVLPLSAPEGGVDLADPAIVERFGQVPPPGRESGAGTVRHALEGLYSETAHRDIVGPCVYALLLREGGVEFFEAGIGRPGPDALEDTARLNVHKLETRVLRALGEAAKLTEEGLLPLPVVISLQLLEMRGIHLFTSARVWVPDDGITRPFQYDEIPIAPAVITSWGAEAELAAKRLFDVIWQACGYLRSFHYDDDGVRISGA